jgi:hypothetical protein
VTIAQSKYLGGDIEHTHLVKGLDFALLQKTRADLSASEASVAAERKAAAEKVAAPKAVGRNRSAAASRPIGTAAMPPPPRSRLHTRPPPRLPLPLCVPPPLQTPAR